MDLRGTPKPDFLTEDQWAAICADDEDDMPVWQPRNLPAAIAASAALWLALLFVLFVLWEVL